MIISLDSKRAIAVTKKDDREYFVMMYDIESYELTFEEKYGGQADSYIKLKEVEQNSNGSMFACAYVDDGKFRVRTFGKARRTEREI